MNRKDFGQLVAALRQDLDWTQFQLSELVDVDEAVISQIERGVKKFFEPELLVKLANALQLTTLERREFFLAASGVEHPQLVRQQSAGTTTDAQHPSKILKRLIETVEALQYPAFLHDACGDAIAINYAVAAYFSIPSEMIATSDQLPGGYNIMRMTFNRELVARTQVADHWDDYALATMLTYRAYTLRYRATSYFRYLLKTFRDPIEYPLFDRFWKRATSVETDRTINTDYFNYRHQAYGPVYYMTTPIVTYTAFGELYITVYQPLDMHTTTVFNQIYSATGNGVVRLAPWPEKKML